jgi:hypothetical protein
MDQPATTALLTGFGGNPSSLQVVDTRLIRPAGGRWAPPSRRICLDPLRLHDPLCIMGIEAFTMTVPEVTVAATRNFYGDTLNYSLELPAFDPCRRTSGPGDPLSLAA